MRLREFTNDTVANWRTIAARNNLANPDLILPGQELDVGDGIVLPKGTTYVVKPGDTLSGIAKNIRQGWRPDADSSATIEPTNPDSTTMGNAIAAAGGQSGASDPDSTTMGNAIASAGGTKSQSPQTKKSQPNPSKYPGGVAKRSAPKQSAPPEVPKPPEINLPRVGPPEVKRGRPTMPADRNQTPPPDAPKSATKPTKPGYHDPAYDAPPDAAPVDDTDIKKRIGADQPIPGYKIDPKKFAKDQELLDKLEKQDRAKQKLPPGRSKPNKAPKPPAGTKTGSSEFDKIRGIESGNRDYDDYSRPITSPKGAKFAAQVMPATNTNPGYGVRPAADSGPEESNRVGKDYFNAMKNKYGNSELAAAAYNAGPGRIDKILQKAKETGQHWKDLLPAETQNYIKKFTGK
jgi:hypothetical protein